MKNLHRLLLGCLALSLACICPIECLHGQTWDELANGGADAGDFPQTDFQMGDGNTYDIIEGTLDPISGDEFDSYLITVTDASVFEANTGTGGFSEDDTRFWLWNTDGTLVMANDDDPDQAPPWLAKITDPAIWTGPVNGSPGSVSNGTDYVLTLGGFNSDPLDAGGIDLANIVFPSNNTDLAGINPASDGVFFTWDYGTNGAGGTYQIQMFGATLAGKGGGCTPGDVNMDGAIDLLDVSPFVEKLVTGTFCCEADINEDGVVDLLDVTPFVDLLTGG